MVRSFAAAALLALLAAASAVLAADSPTCGENKKCPSNLPCCSQYGECGVGAYCLGGCDPKYSNGLDSCTPEPTCQSKDLKMSSLNGIQAKKDYLGDATKADWVADGSPLSFQDQVLLTMAPDTVGTVLASTAYVWYGRITAELKTSRSAGVVTAFILLSDVKDEIDYEWVGTDLTTAQTNFYSQGVTNYKNTENISSISDTFVNYHTYTIDWTPDSITWYVDGKQGRKKERKDTWNATSNRFDYPQTPARVQLSIWPGGKDTNAKGTIDWAGGLINWDSQDIKQNGYYYASVKSVKIECYEPPASAKKSGKTSYIYNSIKATNDTIEITDKPTVLKSLLGTGTNMSADYPSQASGTAKASGSVAVIPGLSGAGPGTDGLRGQQGGSQGGGSGGAASGAPDAVDPAKATQTSFSQGAAKGNGASGKGDKVLQGSLFAGLIAVLGLCVL
ncbi:MAG: hypothetical protein M1814_004879 [Vezdaea aestivalis]|nr:MAG: hypothetical protein M1814_004879 [Vezdaea aestivalis]